MNLLKNNYIKGYEKGFVNFAEILKEITIKKLDRNKQLIELLCSDCTDLMNSRCSNCTRSISSSDKTKLCSECFMDIFG
ncbi:hypothetical protein OAY26_00780 [Acidimicrobiia bacterium]|nr:hypothetical protein [Acidimicrobiia bacterium]